MLFSLRTNGTQRNSILFSSIFLISTMDWQEKDNHLYKKFVFKDFSEAFAFMTRVALAAEKMDHHPRWTNVWNTVEVWLNTHDAGNTITDKDKKLAKAIDTLC